MSTAAYGTPRAEYGVALIALAVGVALVGPGRFALDALLFR